MKYQAAYSAINKITGFDLFNQFSVEHKDTAQEALHSKASVNLTHADLQQKLEALNRKLNQTGGSVSSAYGTFLSFVPLEARKSYGVIKVVNDVATLIIPLRGVDQRLQQQHSELYGTAFGQDGAIEELPAASTPVTAKAAQKAAQFLNDARKQLSFLFGSKADAEAGSADANVSGQSLLPRGEQAETKVEQALAAMGNSLPGSFGR